MEKYVNYRVKIYLKNKHFIKGTLLEIDEKYNVLVDDSEEFKNVKNHLNKERRYLGLVVIKGDFINSIICIYRSIKNENAL